MNEQFRAELEAGIDSAEDMPDDAPANERATSTTETHRTRGSKPPPLPTLRFLRDDLSSAVELMNRRRDKLERPIETPWASVNEKMRGGLWPGLYTLASGSGTGKTQFAVQIALEAARRGIPALYLALELDKASLIARALGLLSRQKWSDLYYGKGDLQDAMEKHQSELRRIPMSVVEADATGWSYTNLMPYAEALRAFDTSIANTEREAARNDVETEGYSLWMPDERRRLLVVDYVQLIGPPEGRREDVRQTIGTIAKVLRDIARKHSVAVLALSSTARVNYGAVDGTGAEMGRDGKPRKVTPLGQGDPARFIGYGKESGELEFTADGVLALAHEPKDDATDNTTPRTSWLALAKARGFETGWVEMRFDGGRFDEPRAPLASRRVELP